MDARKLFEDELRRRAFAFTIDPQSGRHAVKIGDWSTFVSLENLERDFASDRDEGRISRFVDAIIASTGASRSAPSAEGLYWCLEPNDYAEKADFRVVMSDQVDRVLVHLSADSRLVTWVTPAMLDSLGLSESAAAEAAFRNLGRALGEATLEAQDIGGVQLGMFGSKLAFKSSLILAPNLREIVEPKIGWPLMAVVPCRDFLYVWAAQHRDFVGRVGRVVVEEYAKSAYPISTEVYQISEQEIRAIGEFPKED